MKRSYINPKSKKQKAKDLRELPIKLEILERANNRCEHIENNVRCETMGTWFYPLSVHHKDHVKRCKGLELKTKEDGLALCIVHHARAEGERAQWSEPQWSKEERNG
ncbi:hypothetical protein LCGC14_0514430 [marine sediment metagenome]|uniref:Uncharacterized protein n=1 Tax=marine sediment metagenome TaxID=412755 RepID=A0A0F9S510_9ZZZZ